MNRRLSRHRPERRDLRNFILAVAIAHVINDLVAANVAQVNVNIGQRDAFGVKEPLKEEPILNRVEFGNPQDVSDKTARR